MVTRMDRPSRMPSSVRRSQTTKHAGRQFVEYLASENAPDFALRLQELEATILSGQTSVSGQAQRAARRFALLALAGELATGYGNLGWPRG